MKKLLRSFEGSGKDGNILKKSLRGTPNGILSSLTLRTEKDFILTSWTALKYILQVRCASARNVSHLSYGASLTKENPSSFAWTACLPSTLINANPLPKSFFPRSSFLG